MLSTPAAEWVPADGRATIVDVEDEEITARIPEFAQLLALSMPEPGTVDLESDGWQHIASAPIAPPESVVRMRGDGQLPAAAVTERPASAERARPSSWLGSVLPAVACVLGVTAIAASMLYAVSVTPTSVAMRSARWPTIVDVHRAAFARVDVRASVAPKAAANSEGARVVKRTVRVVPTRRAKAPVHRATGIVRTSPY